MRIFSKRNMEKRVQRLVWTTYESSRISLLDILDSPHVRVYRHFSKISH
jgi:hypothetical protein